MGQHKLKEKRPTVKLRRREIFWPQNFDDELVKLYERTRKEVPEKAAKSFEDFVTALALNGLSIVKQALDQEKRQTSLIVPATRIPDPKQPWLRST